MSNNTLSKISSESEEFMVLFAKAICGDKISETQLIGKIGKSVLSLPDKLFYSKLGKFLNGVRLEDDEKAKMRAWITQNGTEEENGLRLISYIDNAVSMKKVEYIANATRCSLNYNLELELYFRICGAIDMSLEEDLRFLANNIPKNYNKTFEQNYYTQKLYMAGLMDFITNVYDNSKHRFNSFAKLTDVCAISFQNDAKYPNPKQIITEIKSSLNF